MSENMELKADSNKPTKYYIRCGQMYNLMPVVTSIGGPKQAAINATVGIIKMLMKVVRDSSQDDYDKFVEKMTPKKKIRVSLTGVETPEEFDVSLKEFGLSKTEIADLQSEWKKNHTDDMMFDLAEIQKLAMDRVKKEMKNRQAQKDENPFDTGYDEDGSFGGGSMGDSF